MIDNFFSMISVGTILILTVLLPYTCALGLNPEWIVYDASNSGLPSSSISTVAIDNNGVKWVGSEGLASFDGNSWTVYDTTNSDLPSNSINSITIENSETRWIGTDNGLALFDGTTWTVYDTSNSDLPSNSVYTIAIDASGMKWIGTNAGLASFDGIDWAVYDTSNSGLPDNRVGSIAFDSNDLIWLACYWLASFDGNNWAVYDTSDSGSYLVRRAEKIVIDENDVKWIGTGGCGLVAFDGSSWTTYNNSGVDVIFSLAIDGEGTKWFGVGELTGLFGPSPRGLVKLNGENWVLFTSGNSSLPTSKISSIAIDDNGNKWIGTQSLAGEGWFAEGGLAVYQEGGVVAVDDGERKNFLPSSFILFQNYPNPFNPTTTISYSLPEAGDVKMLIYDVRGRSIKSLESGYQPAGKYAIQWNGTDDSGNPVSTGVY
ncbi:hypothetical protein HQ531_10195, partial [bacterium]|nr:hypothetical protein [bacterium]